MKSAARDKADRLKWTTAVSDTMEFYPLYRSGFPYNGRSSDSRPISVRKPIRAFLTRVPQKAQHGGIYGAAS